ncbi:MAG TPA: CsbD family protein [Gemmatimonadaceae bacterium]
MKDLNEKGLENQVKGTGKEMKGKIRGDLGDATDNASEHIKGRAEELEGKVQKNIGKGQRKADLDDDI